MKEIGQKIRDRRVELGINQQTLADLAEVGINTVVAIERGTGNPSITTSKAQAHRSLHARHSCPST